MRDASFALILSLASALPLQAEPDPVPASSVTEEGRALGAAVARCWNIAGLPHGTALRITVGFDIDAESRPVPDTIQLVDPSGDDDMDAQNLYATAKRAVLRCGSNGLPVTPPAEGRLRRLEITFDTAGLR